MIHHAANSFNRLSMTSDGNSRRSSNSDEPTMRQVEDEWEDER